MRTPIFGNLRSGELEHLYLFLSYGTGLRMPCLWWCCQLCHICTWCVHTLLCGRLHPKLHFVLGSKLISQFSSEPIHLRPHESTLSKVERCAYRNFLPTSGTFQWSEPSHRIWWWSSILSWHFSLPPSTQHISCWLDNKLLSPCQLLSPHWKPG